MREDQVDILLHVTLRVLLRADLYEVHTVTLSKILKSHWSTTKASVDIAKYDNHLVSLWH